MDELRFYEECPVCHERGDLNEVLVAELPPVHKIVEIYNSLVKKWNKFWWTVYHIFYGNYYSSRDPWILQRITRRTRFSLVPWWFYKLLPTLPYWKPVLGEYFIVRCKHCGVQILTEDPRDFVHFYDPDEFQGEE